MDNSTQIEEIITLFSSGKLANNDLSETIKSQLQNELILHTIRLHHVLKIENNKHNIPGKRKLKNLLEIDGIYLHKILNLCIAIHGRQKLINYQIPFTDGFEWFYKINLEFLRCAAHRIINPIEFKSPIYNGEKKRYQISELNKFISELKILKSPIDESDLNNPYSLLIYLGIKLAENSTVFKKNYWNPYIVSWRNLAKDLNSPSWHLVVLEDGVLKRHNKGRSKIIL